MKRLMLSLFLLSSILVMAQQTGTLKVYISPPAETIMIDDTELKFGNTAELKAGKYFLKAWAPDKKLLDTIIEVKAGEVNSFFYRFQPSEEYLDHRKVLAQYSKERTRHFVLPATATVLVGGSLLFTYLKGRQLRTDALNAYDEYYYAHTDQKVAEKRAEFVDLQSKYEGYVTAYYIEWGALALSSYFLYKGIKWIQKNKQPVYDQPKNPLALEGIGMSRDPFGNYTIGLTLNLN